MRDWHSSSFQHGLSSLHERGAFAGPVLSVSAGASPPCHLRSSHSLPPVPSPFSLERPCLPLMIVISPLSFFTSPTPENPICPPEVLSLVKGNPACQLKQGVRKKPPTACQGRVQNSLRNSAGVTLPFPPPFAETPFISEYFPSLLLANGDRNHWHHTSPRTTILEHPKQLAIFPSLMELAIGKVCRAGIQYPTCGSITPS